MDSDALVNVQNTVPPPDVADDFDCYPGVPIMLPPEDPRLTLAAHGEFHNQFQQRQRRYIENVHRARRASVE